MLDGPNNVDDNGNFRTSIGNITSIWHLVGFWLVMLFLEAVLPGLILAIKG